MTQPADASSPHFLSSTITGRYLVIMPRHLTFPRSASLGRLLLLVLIASGLLWLPLLVREARSNDRPVTASHPPGRP